ncbi:MAG: glycosyltransferase family 4 protein [Candidatus Acidiferrales bacterium]
MFTNFIVGCVSWIVSALAIAWALDFAKRRNLFDAPGELKIHKHPIPRIGGAGMMAGFLTGCLFSVGLLSAKEWLGIGVVMGVGLMGLTDDLWNLGAGTRLCVQLLGGMILGLSGWNLDLTGIPALDLAATSVVFALFINSFNMLDGMDGLSAGVSAIAASGLLLVFPGSTFGSRIASITIAICLAMLLYNRPPASTFMGDSGSTLLGALFGLLSLECVRALPGHSVFPPLLILAIPLADSAFAILRRLRTRQSPFLGDRRHFYDLLLGRGKSLWAILIGTYALSALFALVGCYSAENPKESLVIAVAMSLILLLAGYSLGSLSAADTKRMPAADIPTTHVRIES